MAVGFGWFTNNLYHQPKTASNPISQVKPRPLEKYSIENLSKVQIMPSEVKIGSIIKEDPQFTSYNFSFELDPTLQNKEKKKVTGLINIPKKEGKLPLIVMLRGYADQKTYTTGVGTQRAGEYFAKNGYITIAPNFLGYAGSDSESGNIFESRFQTYTTALVLLKSLEEINGNPNLTSNPIQSTNQLINHGPVSIWGHSNGGQIALTILEVTGANYPTVLWAPVSKPFPYSVLYYTDDSDDLGKLIRRELANFEEDYDVDQFSIHRYYDRIKAPIQLHQGAADDAVPSRWSFELNKKLNELGVDIEYLVYRGADHNLNPSWSVAVQKSLEFFNSHIAN